MKNFSWLYENAQITLSGKDLLSVVDYCIHKSRKEVVDPAYMYEHLSIERLSKYLKLSVSTIREMVEKEEIPCFNMHGLLIFSKSSIDEWMSNFWQPAIIKSGEEEK